MSLPNYRGRRMIEGSTNPEVDVEQNAEIDDASYDHLTPDSASAGPPTAGTFDLNAWWRDVNFKVWRCTVAGTPGTWVAVTSAQYTETPIVLRGLLTDSGLWGIHQRPYGRTVYAIEITIDGNPPSGSALVIQFLVGGVLKSQQYTVSAAGSYAYVAVTGDGNGGAGSGLLVAANTSLQAKVITASATSDATLNILATTP